LLIHFHPQLGPANRLWKPQVISDDFQIDKVPPDLTPVNQKNVSAEPGGLETGTQASGTGSQNDGIK
jgi:hypothetical protein